MAEYSGRALGGSFLFFAAAQPAVRILPGRADGGDRCRGHSPSQEVREEGSGGDIAGAVPASLPHLSSRRVREVRQRCHRSPAHQEYLPGLFARTGVG